MRQSLPDSFYGSETGSIGCHGAPGVSNTAGAALWVVDYTLQAATQDISQVLFHEGIGYKYNFVSFFVLSPSSLTFCFCLLISHPDPDSHFIFGYSVTDPANHAEPVDN